MFFLQFFVYFPFYFIFSSDIAHLNVFSILLWTLPSNCQSLLADFSFDPFTFVLLLSKRYMNTNRVAIGIYPMPLIPLLFCANVRYTLMSVIILYVFTTFILVIPFGLFVRFHYFIRCVYLVHFCCSLFLIYCISIVCSFSQ